MYFILVLMHSVEKTRVETAYMRYFSFVDDVFIEVYNRSALNQSVDRVLAGHYSDAIAELADTVIKRAAANIQ